MKTYRIETALWAFLVLGAAACGRLPQTQNRTQSSVCVPVQRQGSDTCPLAFAPGHCAAVDWISGPTADKPSAFRLLHWKQGRGDRKSGPYADPLSTPTAFFQMKCCGSISPCPLQKNAAGVYEASDVKLGPGEYSLFVQWRAGTTCEQSSVEVSID